ncbi:hypothetical protein L7F22_053070 [Adiantum nelumboides]|nr:hypothetical protein [Adiantum nelumboides]
MATVVKLRDLEELVIALVDNGSETNLIATPDHGWLIRAANMLPGDLYGTCANGKLTIEDVSDEQCFFIQEHSSYPLILGRPYIMAVRMETKVLDDGSAYARIRSRDGKRVVQFLTVRVNHARNKDNLRDHPLPRIHKEFQENRFLQDFLGVPYKAGLWWYSGRKILQRESFSSRFLGLTSESSLSYKKFNELPKWEKQYIIEVLYQLLRKHKRFVWEEAHMKAIKKLKNMLLEASTLRRVDYKCGRPVMLIVDTSLAGIGWAISQDDDEGHRYAVRFGAKEHSSYPLILGQPYIMALRMETKVLDDGSAYERIRSRDGKRVVQFLLRDYGGTVEGKILQRETFSSRFLGLTSEGSLSYKKFNELPKWKKQYIIELEEIKRNRLQKGTKMVNVHSMDAYEMLLQLNQDFEDAIEQH